RSGSRPSTAGRCIPIVMATAPSILSSLASSKTRRHCVHNERVVIGITPSIDRGQRLRAGADYYYVRRAYAERIGALGGVSFVLTLDTPVEAAVELCHGFVI